MSEHIGVAEAKRRFSELADRVGEGESFVIVDRGHPVLALVPPQRVNDLAAPPSGLAACAGAPWAASGIPWTRTWPRSSRRGRTCSTARPRVRVTGYCFDTDVISATIKPSPPMHLIRRLAVLPTA